MLHTKIFRGKQGSNDSLLEQFAFSDWDGLERKSACDQHTGDAGCDPLLLSIMHFNDL